MGSTCRRIGCREHAVAALRFDAADGQVWIDSWVGPDDNGQWLCALHLLRFTAPTGWRVIDRRGSGPEVVISEPVAPVAPVAPVERAPAEPPAPVEPAAVEPVESPAPVEPAVVEPVVAAHDRPSAGQPTPAAPPSGLLGKALAAVGDQRSILTGAGIDAIDESVPDA